MAVDAARTYVFFMQTAKADAHDRREVAPDEAALRERLGVPRDAARVLVFSESSHWDTNWLNTSEEYFERRLKPIFTAMMDALERDPGRVYCIESVFFLKMYWERHPEHRERLRALVERRQLRVLASSFTTPDTLLPHEESLFRDFHLGQAWLRSQRLHVEPRTAYFPDNFGHSPHLPSLMSAVGVEAVSLTRIDGMHFIASDYRSQRAFPFERSTAALLQKDLRTLDFVWRSDDGAEVLCHWNAFTYFQGDMLAHLGVVRWAGVDAAIPWRTRRHIARRIDGFVRQLAPLARTPYLLCPIGMDFNAPIPDLRPLLERYNRERYADTGTFVVLAGLDDYFELVSHHRAALPALSIDPNPYWMGFYASRPESKQRPARVARSLVLAERLSAHEPPRAEIEDALSEAWHALVLHNHHDAITGTSPDRVWHGEQKPLLERAEVAARRALALAALTATPERVIEPHGDGSLRWWREGSTVRVVTPRYRLTLSEDAGGCVASLVAEGEELLAGGGFDLVAYADEGGLWRLGHEYAGGAFKQVDRASRHRCPIDVKGDGREVTLTAKWSLRGHVFTRTLTCRADAPELRLRVAGVAARRLTVTCAWETALANADLEMDTVGGRITRPHERHHRPTFWPVPTSLTARGASRALHACFEAPSAASLSPEGALEWIVARNAPKERAFFGLLPVLAHPIGGTVDETQTHEAAVFVTAIDRDPAALLRRVARSWLPEAHRALDADAAARVRCDDPAVTVGAFKRADRGEGLIVRLVSDATPRTVSLGLAGATVDRAARCDARERDLEALAVDGGRARVPLQGRFTTVRLVPRERS